MKERPIILRADEIRAVLETGKAQIRRPIKRGQVFRFCREGEGPCDLDASERRAINAEPFRWDQDNPAHPSMSDLLTLCPFGVTGDRLWVRESFTYVERNESSAKLKRGESRDHRDAEGFGNLINRLVHDGEDYIKYMADGTAKSLGFWSYPHPIYEHCIGRFRKITPAMSMPSWASRITLKNVNVSVEHAKSLEWSLDVETTR